MPKERWTIGSFGLFLFLNFGQSVLYEMIGAFRLQLPRVGLLLGVLISRPAEKSIPAPWEPYSGLNENVSSSPPYGVLHCSRLTDWNLGGGRV